MALIDECVYKELEDLFENLKKSCQKIADDANNESGDKLQETTTKTQEKLTALSTRLDEILCIITKDNEAYPKITAMKASLLYEKAKILLSTEENSECKTKLDEALALITEIKEHPLITYLYLRCVNHLAYVLSKLGDFDKSRKLLEDITNYELNPNVLVYSTEELFSTGEIDKTQSHAKLHKLAINNHQMLSWVYIKQGLDLESARIQHEILERELAFGESDPVDWATRCARIAVLHLSKMRWLSARYYLSSAGNVLDRLERDMIDHPELAKAQAELARGWIYYALRLFDASKAKDIDRICNEIFRDESSSSVSDVCEEPKQNPEDEEVALDPKLQFKFAGQDVRVEEVPATFIKNLEQAKALFYYTNTWLKRARLYYTLRDHPFMYVSCVLDLSELYRYLAFYETDLDSQYNVQKRRADALETLSGILKEVRPQCYIAVSVELLRELAEVQIELMGLNLKRIYKMQEASDNPDNIKRRLDAVSTIQTKLEKFGNMLGHGNLDEQEGSQETSGNPRDCIAEDGNVTNERQSSDDNA
ncbi:kif1-binding protein [Holotrichia oblita]|uniref:Kif1-binding protein n=1 Tax=Holotrichia oblita TaxID=644536 RepID=A0ACB9T798_HOLOL|nr:kif1-binding protein [Holotrichia oblita]